MAVGLGQVERLTKHGPEAVHPLLHPQLWTVVLHGLQLPHLPQSELVSPSLITIVILL